MTPLFPCYSVIIPVYNNASTLAILYDQIVDFFDKQLKKSVEIVFVDDFSQDNSWSILEGLHNKDSRVSLIRLKNNVGQHQATLLGLINSVANERITIDADLQIPPTEIIKLINAVTADTDVVIGPYIKKQHGRVQNCGSYLADCLLWILFGKPRNLKITSFKLFKKEAVAKLKPYCGEQGYLAGFILQAVAHNRIVNSEKCRHDKAPRLSSYSWMGRIKMILTLLNQALRLDDKKICIDIDTIIKPEFPVSSSN